MAYFECFYELKLITDLLFEVGISQTNLAISDTAEYGEYVSGKKIITDDTKKAMKEILDKIRSGEFAKNWIAEARAGKPYLLKARQAIAQRKIELVGNNLRKILRKEQG